MSDSAPRTKKMAVRVNGVIVRVVDVPIVKAEQPYSGRSRIRVTNTATPTPVQPRKVCPYLGPIVKHVKNELCGCKGKFESVHACTHFNEHATTTQYKHNQPERCCIGCPIGPFSADF